jgi:hypothetical protein
MKREVNKLFQGYCFSLYSFVRASLFLLLYTYFYIAPFRPCGMISYTELYELLRKEKYTEILQALPPDFLLEVSVYLQEKRDVTLKEDGLFREEVLKSRKQFDNSLALFKELMRIRRKKLLSLVHVATETGIMKRDYEHMLGFEREFFDSLVKAAEHADKELLHVLQGTTASAVPSQKLILFTQQVAQFVSMTGDVLGPFASGELANLSAEVSDVLVQDGKATYVDA